MNLFQMMLKNLKFVVATTVVSGVLSAGAYWSGKRSNEPSPQATELEARLTKAGDDYAALKTRYDNLETDRNNILTQTKHLFGERAKLMDLEQKHRVVAESEAKLSAQKAKLLRMVQHQKDELRTLRARAATFSSQNAELTARNQAVSTEVQELRATLQRKVETSPQYMGVTKANRALDGENAQLKASVKKLNEFLKKANDRIKKIQGRDRSFAQQIQKLRKSETKLVNDNKKMVKTNAALNKAVEEAPARFKAMAQENKELVKETAEMHYNLGVFFTEQKSFDRAAKEFQRALKFDPNNAKIHYNLGYLYSETLDRHDLAVTHFNRYLQLQPNSRESEQIRSYLMVRQSYDPKITKH